MRKPGFFRRLMNRPEGLHWCPDCGRPAVGPIEWETDGPDHWLIALRCGECETWREVRVTNAEAKEFDYALDRQCAQIKKVLDRIDRERMEAEVDALIGALEHDLIDAADFSH